MPKNNNQAERNNKQSKKTSLNNNTEKVIYPFADNQSLDDDKIFIECPGATVYDPDSREVIAGIEFIDEDEPTRGYRIVGQQVFAPEHRSRRLIKKEHRFAIRRCQACQDLTVRLMRREGVDFFIPSPKHPRKTKLKSIDKDW